jgi:hypothetical protein
MNWKCLEENKLNYQLKEARYHAVENSNKIVTRRKSIQQNYNFMHIRPNKNNLNITSRALLQSSFNCKRHLTGRPDLDHKKSMAFKLRNLAK